MQFLKSVFIHAYFPGWFFHQERFLGIQLIDLNYYYTVYVLVSSLYYTHTELLRVTFALGKKKKKKQTNDNKNLPLNLHSLLC